MSDVFLIRHAETEWTLSGRHTGRSDIPLTPEGEQAAPRTGRREAATAREPHPQGTVAFNGDPIAPGESAPLGAPSRTARVNFSVFSKDATWSICCCSTTANAARARARRRRSSRHATAPITTGMRSSPGCGRDRSTRTAPTALRARARAPLRRGEGAARSVRAGGGGARRLRPQRPRAGPATTPPMPSRAWSRIRGATTGKATGRSSGRLRETVIYEMHVRGFTRHPSSGVAPARRGTYAGLVEKIPYLQDLGITAVELLPVFQFDPQHAPERRQLLGLSADVVLRAAPRLQLDAQTRSACSTSSATWSRRSIAPASR